jgi:hypothetical protein
LPRNGKFRQIGSTKNGIAKLSQKSDGLFIYAATACRFLDAEEFSDPDSRQELLDVIFDNLVDRGAPQEKADEIYLKVLSFRHLENARVTTRRRFFASITKILGFIAVFFEPVSTSSLADFLLLQRPELDEKLRRLHSVIAIPREENLPITLVHLSFRDFLLSEERSQGLPFRVGKSSMHRAVLERCLELMRQDICNLASRTARVRDCSQRSRNQHLTSLAVRLLLLGRSSCQAQQDAAWRSLAQ